MDANILLVIFLRENVSVTFSLNSLRKALLKINIWLFYQFQVETVLYLQSEGICSIHVSQCWLIEPAKACGCTFPRLEILLHCTLSGIFFNKSLTEVSTAGTKY